MRAALCDRRIHALAPQLANQIAAGEVIERPASVVKELLENALDAGASHIEVELEAGGTRLIRVRDNGAGIHRDDMLLAVAPHATSKLRSAEELATIGSLGFRGEALASISSVTRLRLSSRRHDSDAAWCIAVGRDSVKGPEPCAHPPGTTVEASELFYTVPARRKFLRAERTEFAHVESVVRHLALSRFDVAITLRHNGRQVLRLRSAERSADHERRVAEVLGRGFMHHAQPIEHQAAGLHLRGWLSTPEAARSQADMAYFYLNGRMIRDKLVSHAIRQAYGDSLPEGRYPAYVLYLEIDPGQVDVNVHPTKHEVRFRQSRLVHDFLYHSLQKALNDHGAPVLNGLPGVAAGGTVDSAVGAGYAQRGLDTVRAPVNRVGARVAEPLQSYARLSQPSAEFGRSASRVLKPAPLPQGGLGEAQCNLDGLLLVRTRQGGWLLVDLAAAQRRLCREQLQAALRETGQVRSQPLLVPVSVPVTAAQLRLLEQQQALLASLGFVLEPLADGMLAVRQIPAALRGAAIGPLVEALLQSLSSNGECVAAELVDVLLPFVPLSPGDTPLTQHAGTLDALAALDDRGAETWRSLTADELRQWLFAQQPGGTDGTS